MNEEAPNPTTDSTAHETISTSAPPPITVEATRYKEEDMATGTASLVILAMLGSGIYILYNCVTRPQAGDGVLLPFFGGTALIFVAIYMAGVLFKRERERCSTPQTTKRTEITPEKPTVTVSFTEEQWSELRKNSIAQGKRTVWFGVALLVLCLISIACLLPSFIRMVHYGGWETLLRQKTLGMVTQIVILPVMLFMAIQILRAGLQAQRGDIRPEDIQVYDKPLEQVQEAALEQAHSAFLLHLFIVVFSGGGLVWLLAKLLPLMSRRPLDLLGMVIFFGIPLCFAGFVIWMAIRTFQIARFIKASSPNVTDEARNDHRQ